MGWIKPKSVPFTSGRKSQLLPKLKNACLGIRPKESLQLCSVHYDFPVTLLTPGAWACPHWWQVVTGLIIVVITGLLFNGRNFSGSPQPGWQYMSRASLWRPQVGPVPLQWRHDDNDGVSNHQPHGCLLNRLFRRSSKKTSKLRVTGLCVGNSPGPVNSPHKGPVTRKMFPFDDVIMSTRLLIFNSDSDFDPNW